MNVEGKETRSGVAMGSSFYRVLLLLLSVQMFVWAAWPGVGENLPVCTAAGEQYTPQLVSDNRDGCVVIWFDSRNGMELINVFGQRIGAQGDTLWTPGGVQFTNVASYTWISYLVACADGNGGAFFAWEDPRSGNFDVYVQHADSTGAASWTADGVQLTVTGDDEYVNGIAADGRGGCIVAWQRTGAANTILAQRVNAAGSKVWATNGVEVSAGTNDGTRSRIVADGDAGIVACWLDGRYHPGWNAFKDIYAQRIDSIGTACWADTGIVVLGFGSAPYYAFPELIANDAGRFFVAWGDWRSTGFDIYAQYLSSDGQALWGTHGVPVCTNPLDQTGPRIAPGPSDGLFCVWVDNNTAIGAQMLNAAGVVQWTTTGVIMASTTYDFLLGNAFCTSNGLYGAIFGENAYGGNDRIVKAQALNASGSSMWSSGGEPVSTVVSPKSNIRAVPDTCGGIIAIWTDDRNGSYTTDIYAQRIDPAVSIDETRLLETNGSSLRCMPNLCRGLTTIQYHVDHQCAVELSVCDVLGRPVRGLFSGPQESGSYDVVWDTKDERGIALPAGVYFVSLEIGIAERAIEKVTVLP